MMKRQLQQLFSSTIPMFANLAILVYVCRRLLAATRERYKIMTEMQEFSSIVHRARDNLRYISEQVARGMEEIKDDVGRELLVTDRLTTQSAKLAAVLKRFASLEETVIELVRTDRNRESVRIETPIDVKEEVKRIVAASMATIERKMDKEGRSKRRRRNEKADGALAKVENGSICDYTRRNPLSKFSAYGPRETGFARNSVDDQLRAATMPEVRLLGESKRPSSIQRVQPKRAVCD